MHILPKERKTDMEMEMPKPRRTVEKLPLSEDAAMNEAAELKAQIVIKNKELAKSFAEYGGEWEHWQPGEPKGRDYAEALKAVQELKEIAENEPESQKAMYAMGRVMNDLLRLGVMPLVAFDITMASFVANFDTSYPTEKMPPGMFAPLLKDMDNTFVEALNDAQRKLTLLQTQAAREMEKDRDGLDTLRGGAQ